MPFRDLDLWSQQRWARWEEQPHTDNLSSVCPSGIPALRCRKLSSQPKPSRGQSTSLVRLIRGVFEGRWLAEGPLHRVE